MVSNSISGSGIIMLSGVEFTTVCFVDQLPVLLEVSPFKIFLSSYKLCGWV